LNNFTVTSFKISKTLYVPVQNDIVI